MRAYRFVASLISRICLASTDGLWALDISTVMDQHWFLPIPSKTCSEFLLLAVGFCKGVVRRCRWHRFVWTGSLGLSRLVSLQYEMRF